MIKPNTASGLLRNLADRMDNGEYPAFSLIVVDPDGDISEIYNAGVDKYYQLLGALTEQQYTIIKETNESEY